MDFIYNWKFLVFLIFFVSCGDAVPEVHVEDIKLESPSDEIVVIPDREKMVPADEYQIKHPLRDVKLIDGKVPGIDIHDDPITHKRLAVGEITTSEEDKPMKTTSGIIELDVNTYEPQPKEGRKVSVASSCFVQKLGTD